MRSDFLDTSNPYLLKAFFAYCDAANLAAKGIRELQITSPIARVCLVGLIESLRQRSTQKALELFGGEVKSVPFAL